MAGVNASVVELEAELEGGQQQLVVLEQERDETQRRLTEQQRSFGETRRQLHGVSSPSKLPPNLSEPRKKSVRRKSIR